MTPAKAWRAATMTVVMALALTGCDVGSDPEATPLESLQLIAVDFELNSMVIENTGDEVVRTEGLWAYRDGVSTQIDIFIVEPRATIRFSMTELGDISAASGEIALASSDSFDDPDVLLQYVAWGQDGFDLLPTATEAGLWPAGDTARTIPDAVVLVRTDPTANGPLAWEPSNQLP